MCDSAVIGSGIWDLVTTNDMITHVPTDLKMSCGNYALCVPAETYDIHIFICIWI